LSSFDASLSLRIVADVKFSPPLPLLFSILFKFFPQTDRKMTKSCGSYTEALLLFGNKEGERVLKQPI
jgi:hypothetical protein